MALKPSLALVAAMMAITAPAFAQDSTASANDAATEAAPETGTLPPAADTPSDTDAATEQPTDAGTAVTETEEAEGEEPNAADAASDSAQAAGEATEAAPATSDATATDAAPEASATDTPATGDGAPADEAATTADPNAEPQVGSYYVKSTHEDWLIRCIRAGEGVDPCELYQLMQDDSGNSVAEVTMIPLEGGEVAVGATVVVPLETDLLFGLQFQVDQGRGQAYPFNFCAPVGCVARVGFPDAELNALKRGNVANVALLPFGGDPENPVQLQLSLTGFTAGLAALEELAVPEPDDAGTTSDAAADTATEADTPESDAANDADAATEETAPAN
ncbi:invasion associated locus B family protein [Paracoccus sp. TK19116]|uniref:Invasion associated locus B family protein n=1 Tax=Paracoccus albicereus TaxID=2922394 RepID=A0ABT1MNZ9_9RHOB|nr:invasion associated locus B family protein [Paracoccus albicereus]MCQ0970012.1 invasion associated locus B family protein [Paracoccus albicereus]